MISVGIVDYGVGNVHSLSKSIRIAGFRPEISSTRNCLVNRILSYFQELGHFLLQLIILKSQDLIVLSLSNLKLINQL